jgi:hypothetical protein
VHHLRGYLAAGGRVHSAWRLGVGEGQGVNRNDIVRMAREAMPEIAREITDEELERFAALVIAAQRHPGYIMGEHWLQAAYTRVCTGEDVRDVMADYGWYP